ncbi:hypothetical protein [Celeribacter sp.]|uniref:hypothetical protein n=1 Tax=Celeribacter sp. TaxID=1890673 RepID=UPI003A8E8B5B
MLKFLLGAVFGAGLCYAGLVAASPNPMGPLMRSKAGAEDQRIFEGPMWHSGDQGRYQLAEFSAVHCERIAMELVGIEIKSRMLLADLLPPKARLICAPRDTGSE